MNKDKIYEIVQSYLGMNPDDKGCANFAEMQEKMVKEICDARDEDRFTLNDNERQSLEEFLEQLSKKYQYMPVKLKFSNGGGIGRGLHVKVGKFKADITDYSSW